MEIKLIQPFLCLSKYLYLNGDFYPVEDGESPLNKIEVHDSTFHVKPEMSYELWNRVKRQLYGLLIDKSNPEEHLVTHFVRWSESLPDGLLESWYEVKDDKWVREERFESYH